MTNGEEIDEAEWAASYATRAMTPLGLTPLDLSNMKAHPYADMFNMIEEEHRPALRASIEKNGLYDKVVIILYQGEWRILDGRNRYRELKYLGWHILWENFVKWETLVAGGIADDPFNYVVSKNLDRRQMDESQRAIAAARVANMRQGERNDIKALPFDGSPSANVRKVSQGEAAKMFSVSERLVTSANTIVKMGAPKLVALVEAGRVPVSVAEGIARLPSVEQERALSTKKPEQLKTFVKQLGREQRAKALAEKQEALPLKKYAIILCDNEWDWETRTENGMDRAPGYPVSSLEALQARRVQDIAADDCVLFMWATPPKLIEAFLCAQAWGFVEFAADPITGHYGLDKSRSRYVSEWVWLKDKIITGYWGRGRHEHLLIFTKGSPVAPAMGTQPNSIIECPAFDEPAAALAQPWKEGLHSAKPTLFHEWIERFWPDARKLEMNARDARPGWDMWGNEAPKGGDIIDGAEGEPWFDVATKAERDAVMAARVDSQFQGMTAADLIESLPPPVKSSPEEIEERRRQRRKEKGLES